MDIFKTGTLQHLNDYCDTLRYDNKKKLIVLPVKVNGVHRKMIFDTGADIVLLTKDSSNSKIKIKLNANESSAIIDVVPLHNIELSNNHYSDLYAIRANLPAPILCVCDGIIGNNIIKSSNWKITENMTIISNKPFDIQNEKLSLNIFYYSSNRLHSNIVINNIPIDTCLFDYGGIYDIELPISFFERNKASFKQNKIAKRIKSSYNAIGKSLPDTVLRLNCNIDFNGIQIDSVNIVFSHYKEKRIGYLFLKRFKNIVINNSSGKLLFSDLIKTTKPIQHEPIFKFDLIDGFFVVDSKILNELSSSELNIGDRIVEINSFKSNDFKTYCDFFNWSDGLIKYQYLDLKTTENKIIRINNWR
jgi:hypothetical protein